MLYELITELKPLSQEARHSESRGHSQTRHENWRCHVTCHQSSHLSVATQSMWLIGMSSSGDLILPFLTACVPACTSVCLCIYIHVCILVRTCACEDVNVRQGSHTTCCFCSRKDCQVGSLYWKLPGISHYLYNHVLYGLLI